MTKKKVKMDYPYASIGTTQTEDIYELYIAMSEEWHISIYLTEKKLQDLERDIKAIRDFQNIIIYHKEK